MLPGKANVIDYLRFMNHAMLLTVLARWQRALAWYRADPAAWAFSEAQVTHAISIATGFAWARAFRNMVPQ